MDDKLNLIRDFADQAHGNQMRKYTPERYIVHPVRVMELCQPYNNDITVLAAALLHDVLEDTPTSVDQLKAFLQGLLGIKDAHKAVALVVELTDIFTKDHYRHLNRSERKQKELERLELISPDAQTIKYADIADNCAEMVKHDVDFAPVFLHECMQVLQKLNKGHKRLRKRAIAIVQGGLDALHTK